MVPILTRLVMSLVHPHHTITNVVETLFVEGFKFEIVEFQKIAYKDFGINNSKSRFYLVVEDAVRNMSILKRYVEKTGENDWSIICADKQHWVDFVHSVQDNFDTLKRYQDRNERTGKFAIDVARCKRNIFNRTGLSI